MSTRVLIAPLDWGLGHATRCIPVIRELLALECKVFVAGSGDSLALLQQEFPTLEFFSLPPYQPQYPTRRGMVWKMASQLPRFMRVIRQEHRVLEHLVTTHAIDAVIADNRYGCWSARVPSVFITHQSNILMPQRFGWLAPMVRRANERMMKKFSQCWVPDSIGKHNLAGDLISFGGMNLRIPIVHTGPLSRFTTPIERDTEYDILCICSGPEPQRSLFEQLVTQQLRRSNLRHFIVRGLPRDSTVPHEKNCVNFLGGEALQQKIEASACVVARSGYSTIMDLATLGKRAIFIPTPGQTEQEYLAQQCMNRKIAFAMPQQHFDLLHAWQVRHAYTGFTATANHHDALRNAIQQLLSLQQPQPVEHALS